MLRIEQLDFQDNTDEEDGASDAESASESESTSESDSFSFPKNEKRDNDSDDKALDSAFEKLGISTPASDAKEGSDAGKTSSPLVNVVRA